MEEPVKNREYSEDFLIKRAQFRYDFWKYFLGTFILGATAAITTAIFKDAEVRLANRKEESAYLGPYLATFLGTIDEDPKLDKALLMAQFVSRTATDKDLKKGWTDLRIFLKRQIDSIKLTADTLNTRRQEQSMLVNAKMEELRTTLDQASRNTTIRQSDQFKRDTLRLIKQIDSTQLALERTAAQQQQVFINANKVLENPQVLSGAQTSEANYEVIYNGDLWTGRGYFMQVNDVVKVSIRDYLKEARAVTLAVAIAGETFDAQIPVGAVRSFRSSNGQYNVTLKILAYKNFGVNILSREVSYNVVVERRRP